MAEAARLAAPSSTIQVQGRDWRTVQNTVQTQLINKQDSAA